jgi:DNA uptake protein ComE-like DNA-binding protein
MPFRLFRKPTPAGEEGVAEVPAPGPVAGASEGPSASVPGPSDRERLRLEAERRIAEAERRREEAEARLQRVSAAADELRAAEEQLARRREQVKALAGELQETEARLAEAQQQTVEVLDRIAAAERRAREAEEHVRAAVSRVDAEEAAPEPGAAAAPVEPAPRLSGSSADSPININEASYEQLRALRLSVTQTGRLLAYREREGGFKSIDELSAIPGFPRSQLEELKAKLTV